MNYFSEGQLAATIGSPISKPPYGMPKSIPHSKSAEELLKKALEYANQGMNENEPVFGVKSDYADGKFRAFELMAAHLEMLIKEAKQSG